MAKQHLLSRASTANEAEPAQEDSSIAQVHRCRAAAVLLAVLAVAFSTPLMGQESEFAGLIRTKTPDRGSYQPPLLPSRAPAVDDRRQQATAETMAEVSLVRGPGRVRLASGDAPADEPRLAPGRPEGTSSRDAAPNRPVAPHGTMPIVDGQVVDHWPGHTHQPNCDGRCDSYCDAWCDSCCGPGYRSGPLASLSSLACCPDQWFGGIELLMMFRKGDVLPALAETGPAGGPTALAFGQERVLQDMTVGGRLTIGTWLDAHQCRSLVFRGWGTGRESFRFALSSTGAEQISRPFFNTLAGEPDNFEVAGDGVGLNDGVAGNLTIRGSNEVYGGDLAIRHLWLADFGGRIDVIYGYQHLQMRDRLNIHSESMVPGGPISLSDDFRADNRFHGGQFGLAARYREGCWSFDGLIKTAVGSNRRIARRSGDSNPPIGPAGLLVGPTNEGLIRDSTLSWVPELNATIGWRYTRDLDLTFGYHLVAMTNALQSSGMIDTNVDPDGNTAPAADLRFNTFYVQGIHFGLQYVY